MLLKPANRKPENCKISFGDLNINAAPSIKVNHAEIWEELPLPKIYKMRGSAEPVQKKGKRTARKRPQKSDQESQLQKKGTRRAVKKRSEYADERPEEK